MSKAEKFIKENTRNCSNHSEWSVETPNKSIIFVQPWLTPDQARKAVEIAKEDIYEWLRNNAYKYSTFGLYTDAMVTDLKQAMKDET